MNNNPTRRAFLSATTKAVGGLACLAASSGWAKPLASADSGLAMSHATFAPLVQTAFSVHDSPSGQKLLLTQVEAQHSKAESRGPKIESFSLLFWQDGKGAFAEGTYRFSHQAVGTFDVFIVPVLRSEKGQHYEAIFSRLV